MKAWTNREILITVKTYPNPSKKYEETVCVAGVTIDDRKWVRLYPIRFRDLDEEQKFPKYTIIKANVTKPSDDKRPESLRVDADSIKVIGHLDTKDGWVKRKNIVLPTLDRSMCEILGKSQAENKSLGVFKPRDLEFYWQKARPKEEDARNACYAQLSFFNKAKNAVEIIPFDFRYKFFCQEEPECKGHDFSIIDWEIGQSYRNWRDKYRTEDLLLEKIKERWLDRMCSAKNDIYFYVGNMKRFHNNFMILGVFYPPK